MPQNKNFQKRITILDECFSSRTGLFTLEKLIEVVSTKLELNVSRKTIQNDISDTSYQKTKCSELSFSATITYTFLFNLPRKRDKQY